MTNCKMYQYVPHPGLASVAMRGMKELVHKLNNYKCLTRCGAVISFIARFIVVGFRYENKALN